MIKKIDHQLMGRFHNSWLNTYYHFSFGDYYDAEKMHYGMLRVVNDDTIQPLSRFDLHSHKNMEILTYVVQGECTHRDNEREQTLKRGMMQLMSAGTGIAHSEVNKQDSLLRMIQIWIYPNELDLTPDYQLAALPWHERYNRWLLIASQRDEVPLHLHQDMNIFACELSDAAEIELKVMPLRQVYLVVLEGRVRIEDMLFDAHDGAEIDESTRLKAASWAHVLMFEMAKL